VTALAATVRREMASLWLTPLAWILWVVLLLLQGGVFATIVASFASNSEPTLDFGPLQAFYGQSVFVPLTLLLVCPALTMRSLAEERRAGTIENLLSAPVGASAVVLGKYLACLASFIVFWLPTLLYPVVVRHVMPIDWRVVATSYLGLFSLGAGLLAVGVLCSAMSKSQFVALVLTSGTLLFLVVLGVGENVFDEGWLQTLCGHLSIQSQLAEMAQGVVSLRRLVFDATLVVLPLFLAVRVFESWRWS
jgi:ABC-2 type transport system permease protein